MHVTVQVVNPDDALRAIYLITKKMVVADGSVQKDQYEKSQTVSPTVGFLSYPRSCYQKS